MSVTKIVILNFSSYFLDTYLVFVSMYTGMERNNRCDGREWLWFIATVHSPTNHDSYKKHLCYEAELIFLNFSH